MALFREEKKKSDRIHVISSKDRWGVKAEGSTRVYKYFETKNEAINVARIQADKRHFKVIIHNKNGYVDVVIPAKSR